MKNESVWQTLAAEMLKTYPALDPDRVERAVQLLNSQRQNLVMAKIDENGNHITPTIALWAVRSSAKPPYKNGQKIWYLVRPAQKTCQCADSQRGHVCKHRIAVYLRLKRYNQFELILKPPPASKPKLAPTNERDIIAALGYY